MQAVTLCKDCIFNIKDENNDQIGCEFNRLEKFQSLGNTSKIELKYVKVSDLEDKFDYELNELNNGYEFCLLEDGIFHHLLEESVSFAPDYSKEQSYYSIDRVCNTCRNQSWIQRINDKKLNPKNKSFHDLVLEEISLKLSILVYLDVNSKIENVSSFIADIEKQTMPVFEVIFMNNKSPLKTNDINALFSEKLAFTDKIRVVRILEDNFTEEAAFNVGYGYAAGNYILQTTLPSSIPEVCVSDINHLLNVKLARFCMIEFTNSPNTFVVQTKITKDFNGNVGVKFEEDGLPITNIRDKVKYIANKESQQNYIKTI